MKRATLLSPPEVIADAAGREQLLCLRLQSAFTESRMVIPLILPVALLMVAMLWALVEPWRLAAWCAALALAHGAHLWLYTLYGWRPAPAASPSVTALPNVAAERRWAIALAVALGIAGAAWSALYWLVAANAGAEWELVSAAVVMAVAGVALSGLATLPAAYAVFASTTLLPPALLLLAAGGGARRALSLILVIYLLALVLLALRSCRSFVRAARAAANAAPPAERALEVPVGKGVPASDGGAGAPPVERATASAPAHVVEPAVESGAEPDVPAFDAQALARLRQYQVQGEEDMVSGVLSRFLDSASGQMDAIPRALGEGALDAAGIAAHSMKTGASYAGALRLAAACRRLEQAAHTADVGAAGEALEDLLREYQVVVPLLQEALDQARRA